MIEGCDNDFSAVSELSHQDIVQSLLCLPAADLVVAARNKGIEVDAVSTRQLLYELATVLANEGFIPTFSVFYDGTSDAVDAAPEGATLH